MYNFSHAELMCVFVQDETNQVDQSQTFHPLILTSGIHKITVLIKIYRYYTTGLLDLL